MAVATLDAARIVRSSNDFVHFRLGEEPGSSNPLRELFLSFGPTLGRILNKSIPFSLLR